MSARSKRFQRLAELRKRELDEAAGKLQLAAEELKRLTREVELLESRLAQAMQQRAQLVDSGAEAQDFVIADNWQRAQQQKLGLAKHEQQQAQLACSRAQAHVIQARAKVKAMETLKERADQEHTRMLEVAERKLEDDFAARVARKESP
ncbi:MAG: flagellar export protein FliJ [Myxococcales bacterium]|nr:flagellar export protein FliJ [Myxococcales bacterium]